MRDYGVLVVFAIAAMTFGCGDDDPNGPDGSPIATEGWEATATGMDGSGTGEWDFTMNEDSTIVVSGRWDWIDTTLGVNVACPFTDGEAVVADSAISFTATGTATIPNLPSSPFTLEVEGKTDDGEGDGTFIITFDGTGWPSSRTGTWTATRVSGGGITI